MAHHFYLIKEGSITRVLESLLLFRSHLESIELTLWDWTEVEMLLDIAYLLNWLTATAIRDVIYLGALMPGLGTNEVEPAVAFTPVLAETLVEDVVDSDFSWSRSLHLCAEVLSDLKL